MNSHPVTNLVQQARRLADRTAFFLEGACVEVVEHGDTGEVFVTRKHKETSDYIEGRYG